MGYKLADLSAQVVEAWAKKEAAKRPTTARLAWRLLKGFLSWCAEQRAYSHLLPAQNPAKTKKSRETLGAPNAKKDVLQKDQLKAWFGAVGQLPNPIVSAYLRALLLTGARPGELLNLQWENVNTKWKGLEFRDKVEGERIIPLTPYVESLLAGLPRTNNWVFTSDRPKPKPLRPKKPKADQKPKKPRGIGRIAVPQKAHALACKTAAIDGLTLHGLRRSFSSLTEWLEIPSGVVAQIMGHKPSATAEKHYKVRPLDLLRMHHERIEAWMLEQAKVAFEPGVAKGNLRVVDQ
jgi:integrase